MSWVQVSLDWRENNYGSNASQRCKLLSVSVSCFFFNSVYAQHTPICTNLEEFSLSPSFLLNTRLKCLVVYTKKWSRWHRCLDVSSTHTACLIGREKLFSIWRDALRWPYRIGLVPNILVHGKVWSFRAAQFLGTFHSCLKPLKEETVYQISHYCTWYPFDLLYSQNSPSSESFAGNWEKERGTEQETLFFLGYKPGAHSA